MMNYPSPHHHMFRYNIKREKENQQKKKRSMTNTKRRRKKKQNLSTNQYDVNMHEYHKFEKKKENIYILVVGCV